ncbi:MAG TPA: proline--tRNA ligase [Acidimicrobiia bacterium]|nr:proline--tRNA ligase [Acidimicrobiia bacterium]
MAGQRMSHLFVRTLRDDPADADTDGHRLLLRSGCVRRVASGVYAWLPLGRRVLRRVEAIVREEMDATGAQEVTLPIIQPLELWARSGRDVDYGPLMFRLQDRKEARFCLTPTAEELVTTLVGGEYSSYRDLPVTLYQINWKYRDELRPRFGLIRGREFLMKDAYSFHADVDDLKRTYHDLYDAYGRVFTRCGLTWRAVEAQAGEMGGETNHEFLAVASVGEDAFVWCPSCDYAANVEAARRQSPAPRDAPVDAPPMSPVATPDMPGIAPVAAHLGVPESALLKCLVFEVTGDDGPQLGAALVPGDRDVNEYALARALAPRAVRLLDDDDFRAHPELARGYLGPHHPALALVVADPSVAAAGHAWITGANEDATHVRDAVAGRDFTVDRWADVAAVAPGDACPRCGAALAVDRGIEVGHVFQLGTKYSERLDVRYQDDAGEQHPMVMGCYGIGVSRIVAAVAEEHHDDAGLAWPAALAPFAVHLVALAGRGDAGEAASAAAERLYDQLTGAGVDVLYDDRDASPGVKFADADLLGIPVRLTVGAKGVARGVAERRSRATGAEDELPLDTVVAALTGDA